MTHPRASRNHSEQQAGSLRTGHHLLLPDGERSAQIQRVDVETDDFGTPALVLATLTGGGMLRIAAGSVVTVLDAPEEAATAPGRGDGGDVGTGTGRGDTPGDTPQSATLEGATLEGTAPDRAAEADDTPAPPSVVVPPLPAAPPAGGGPSEEDLALIPSPEGTP
ncbi:MAG: hypothetical protein JWM01_678, partial [Arthrobacter sp.]|nr:hypothetical protein [Arthrobacter sp.]